LFICYQTSERDIWVQLQIGTSGPLGKVMKRWLLRSRGQRSRSCDAKVRVGDLTEASAGFIILAYWLFWLWHCNQGNCSELASSCKVRFDLGKNTSTCDSCRWVACAWLQTLTNILYSGCWKTMVNTRVHHKASFAGIKCLCWWVSCAWLQMLTNAAVDTILQMCVESSTTHSSFIDMCSQSSVAAECFQKMALVWRVSTSEPNLLEKVSIFLQKLSKIRSRSCSLIIRYHSSWLKSMLFLFSFRFFLIFLIFMLFAAAKTFK